MGVTTTDARERAWRLRRKMTPSEKRLWHVLRRRGVSGLYFRRQHPLGPYILDFYCFEARLVVEVDGGVHDEAEQAAHDDRRDAYLARKGLLTLRVPSHDVRDRLEAVVGWIERRALARVEGGDGPRVSPPSRLRRDTSPAELGRMRASV